MQQAIVCLSSLGVVIIPTEGGARVAAPPRKVEEGRGGGKRKRGSEEAMRAIVATAAAVPDEHQFVGRRLHDRNSATELNRTSSSSFALHAHQKVRRDCRTQSPPKKVFLGSENSLLKCSAAVQTWQKQQWLGFVILHPAVSGCKDEFTQLILHFFDMSVCFCRAAEQCTGDTLLLWCSLLCKCELNNIQTD